MFSYTAMHYVLRDDWPWGVFQSGFILNFLFLQTILPASAQDVYYRDEIGNISTSHLQVLEDSVEVEVRPRFPLFGGWKTHYIIGYNLPSYEYLYTLGASFLLKASNC